MNRRTTTLALLLLLAGTAGAADPFAGIPAIPSPDAQGNADCSGFETVIAQLYESINAREQQINDEQDRLEPLVQAEQQAQIAAAMQGQVLDSQAVMASYQGLSSAAAANLETDADCIAWSHDGGMSQNFGVSKGLAPAVREARQHLHAQLKAAPESEYQATWQRLAPQYVAQLNSALASGKTRNAQCASAYQTRTQQSAAQLKGNIKKLMLLQSDAELYRLKRALSLAQDGSTLCMDLGQRLYDYAGGVNAVRGYTAAGRSASAPSSVGDLKQSITEKVKDGAVGKALDKAFGSLFGN